MKEIVKLVYFLLLLNSVSVAAQDKFHMDSLVTELGNETVDSLRCRMMLEIAEAYKTSDTSISLSYLRQIKSFGADLRDKSYLGNAYALEGDINVHFGQYDEAVLAYDRAMALYNEAELSKLRIQYRDYSLWQMGDEQKESIKKQEKYVKRIR